MSRSYNLSGRHLQSVLIIFRPYYLSIYLGSLHCYNHHFPCQVPVGNSPSLQGLEEDWCKNDFGYGAHLHRLRNTETKNSIQYSYRHLLDKTNQLCRKCVKPVLVVGQDNSSLCCCLYAVSYLRCSRKIQLLKQCRFAIPRERFSRFVRRLVDLSHGRQPCIGRCLRRMSVGTKKRFSENIFTPLGNFTL